MLCDATNLPIGFGLGKDSNHWSAVVAQKSFKSTQLEEADPDILGIRDVAQILRCSIDNVRRIPRDVLPARNGPGKENLYLREDLLKYVRGLSGNQRRNSGLTTRIQTTNNTENLKSSGTFDIESARAQLGEA